ncbi:MAG TPA: hypothetical protein VNT32_01300 [Thermoleophilaceae bacterium]|nr:hypothetical protein [Thermoleophilaceae bacterium]
MNIETETPATTRRLAPSEPARFCSRCAAPPPAPDAERRPAFERVCAACGLGVYLTSPAGPPPSTSFIVVSQDLQVSAVSQGAERIVGKEEKVCGSPVTSVLACPDGEAALRRALRRAALGFREASTLPVRAGGGTATAHVLPCGPPRAALVALIAV